MCCLEAPQLRDDQTLRNNCVTVSGGAQGAERHRTVIPGDTRMSVPPLTPPLQKCPSLLGIAIACPENFQHFSGDCFPEVHLRGQMKLMLGSGEDFHLSKRLRPDSTPRYGKLGLGMGG